MGNGVEVCCVYGGLRLTCDEAAFARIRDHLLAESTIAVAVGEALDCTGVQFISVSVPQPVAPPGHCHRMNWLHLAPSILVGTLSFVATVVGLVTIVQWLLN